LLYNNIALQKTKLREQNELTAAYHITPSMK
jgi:hypothetical protein